MDNLPIYFRIARLARNLSDYPKNSKKMGAVIVRAGNILAFSPNKNKSHPEYQENTFIHSIHSELAALIKCQSDTNGAYIYIYREGAKGNLAMAKPCSHCYSALKLAGIKGAYYTTETSFEYLEIN
jgi:deoxycytidylate deaminase